MPLGGLPQSINNFTNVPLQAIGQLGCTRLGNHHALAAALAARGNDVELVTSAPRESGSCLMNSTTSR